MTLDLGQLALQVSQPLHLEDPQVAARMVLSSLARPGEQVAPIQTNLDAFVVLNSFLQALLDNNLYAEAARLLWKPSVFTAEPSSVKEIFDALFAESQVLVQGAASMGKSFSIGVWMYLDWRRDPANTNIQIVGPSENHLKANLFSHLINLHNSSAIPGPGVVTDMCIALNPHDKYAGLKGVVIPLGKKSAGRLQGVKVKPRETPHPTLGNMTRLRVVLEEAENIHVGVWEDIVNLSANAANKQQFKVVGAYNPKDRASQVGVRAEPLDGWQSVDIETSRRWWSKRGWLVIRLDGHRSENVLLGWEKYPGLQSKNGLEVLTLNAGGQYTASWYCADHESEALTVRGWLRHDEIRVGDYAWAIDLKSGKGRWSPVLEVFSAPYAGKMLSVEGRSISALVTHNHRWPVTDKFRVKRGTGYSIKEAQFLCANNELPLAAKVSWAGAPSEDSVDFASLLGWVITDGSVMGGYIRVYQSVEANPHKCGVVRGILGRLSAGHKEYNDEGVLAFEFSGDLARRVRSVLPPGKPFPWAWVADASAYELRAFLDAALEGDGGVQGGSTPWICSVTKEHADGFASVGAQLGMATTTSSRLSKPRVFNGYQMRATEVFQVNFLRVSHTTVKYQTLRDVDYEGVIWCPRTEASTWLCRRKGHVHYTGNTMARGWYPEEGVDSVIIPAGLLTDEECRGEFIFMEEPENVMSVDSALEGGDNAIVKLGRYGRVSGVRLLPTLTSPGGEVKQFKDAKGGRIYRWALQVDQIIPLPKGRTEAVGDNIIRVAKMSGVKPSWLGIDRTGNGAGIHDYVRSKYGDAVHGINASTSSTEMRILTEDKMLPCDEYTLLCTELWFALKKWLQVGAIKLGFNLPGDPLLSELAGRRFIQPMGSPKVRVEPKKAYMTRGNKSPDRADALTILLHVVRLNTHVVQSFKSDLAASDVGRPMKQRLDVTNRFQTLD